jgi:hypothetical protein
MPRESQRKQILEMLQAARMQFDALQYTELLEKWVLNLASDSEDNSNTTSSDFTSTSSTSTTTSDPAATSYSSDSSDELFFFSQEFTDYQNALEASYDEIS